VSQETSNKILDVRFGSEVDEAPQIQGWRAAR
jgi:hypothetical protein